MFNSILLAVDGSTHALHAAHIAGEMARLANAGNIYVVVVFNYIPAFLGEPNMQIVLDARLDEANLILDSAVAELGNVSGKIHSELIEGTPAEAIIDVAKTRKVDLIIMGSRGMGTLAGLLLGSTSQKVVSHADCPVLIVR